MVLSALAAPPSAIAASLAWRPRARYLARISAPGHGVVVVIVVSRNHGSSRRRKESPNTKEGNNGQAGKSVHVRKEAQKKGGGAGAKTFIA